MAVEWNLLETFLRVAEAGSSTAAADALGVSQPTVSRRVVELEQALGVTLFVRHARGLSLTERGSQLLERAQGVGLQVDEMLRQATGMRELPRGEVRISVNEPLGIYVVVPALAELRARYPDIEVELTIDNRSADLSRRQADVAVRMFKPSGAELIARHVGDTPLGLYASSAYLEEHGAPEWHASEPRRVFREHVFIGGDADPDWRRYMDRLGLRSADFAIRTDSLVAQIVALRSGAGIGGTHARFAESWGLTRVVPQLPVPPLPIWLVAHAELRTSAAVRCVLEFLHETLTAWLAGQRPCPW